MKLDDTVKAAIVQHPSSDHRKVSKELTAQFGRFIPPSLIRTTRMSAKRASDIQNAKDTAAGGLSKKMQLMDSVSGDLLEMFTDTALDDKTRLDAVKELRQWTKLGIDTAGIHDDTDDVMFLVPASWDVSAAD